MAFARDYRPHSLKTYVGNEKVKNTVSSILKRNLEGKAKLPQTILISGFTGCGKTTLARILMREYECTGRGIDSEEACGVCQSCQNFDEYMATGNLDLLTEVKEINVAETSGKSDVVSILEDRIYPPMDLKYKYFYFDEVHKASEALQNYLLKPMEEPEEHVVYILATTELDKLIDTLVNRCVLRLNIQRPNEHDIGTLLGGICKLEDIPFEDEAFRMIGSYSDYIIRDCLNHLQQIVDSRGSCTANDVSEVLELATDSLIFDFFNAYISRDYLGYMSVMHKVKTTLSFDSFVLALRNFTVRGLYILNGIELAGVSPNEIRRYSALFGKFDVKQISFLLSKILELGKGSIEANLLALMYSAENVSYSESGSGYKVENSLGGITAGDEARIRTANIKAEREQKTAQALEKAENFAEVIDFSEGLNNFPVSRVKRSPQNGEKET